MGGKEYVQLAASFISASGVIIASLIAAHGARKIVRENKESQFITYADKTHNLRDVLIHAQNDICIVVAIGDKFIENYTSYLENLLDKGVKIRYLLLTENELKKAEYNMCGKETGLFKQLRADVLDALSKLSKRYKGLVECREFDSTMTASYICIDIMPNPPMQHFMPSSVIQAMIYQYKIPAENSPITFISPNRDEVGFANTVVSIKEMWFDAKPINLLNE